MMMAAAAREEQASRAEKKKSLPTGVGSKGRSHRDFFLVARGSMLPHRVGNVINVACYHW